MHGEPEMGLSAGAVAQRLGIAPATLRTWDRRYGIGPSRRSAGRHRRYEPADLARLQLMHRLILQGSPPAEAARAALAEPITAAGGPPAPEGRGHGAGGRRVALAPGTGATARGLARAAMALDSAEVTTAVRAALRQDGVIVTWDRLIVPVLVGIGDRHAATGECVDVEHLFSATVLACLAEYGSNAWADRRAARLVLLACAPEEQHTLPLYALAAALAAEQAAVRLLGARVPAAALTAAITRIGPGAVLVWSQTPATGDPAWLTGLPGTRPAWTLLLGGPGWRGPLPPRARRPQSLAAAAADILDALG